jgi:predicted outer membrane repeat protein
MLRCAAFFAAAVAASLFCPEAPAQDVAVVDVDGFPGSYTCIQDGLDAVGDGGTVYVCSGLSPRGVYKGPLNRGLHFDGKNITLEAIGGGLEGGVVIDCEGLDRAFCLSTGVDTTSSITGFTIVNGLSEGNGGAILAEGGLPVVTDCLFIGNSAAHGGAIWAAGGPIRIRGCDFEQNTATGSGGAALLGGDDTVVENCLFYGNGAGDNGALMVAGSDPLIRDCSFVMNSGSPTACIGIAGDGGLVERSVIAFNALGLGVSGDGLEVCYCCVNGNEGGDELPGDVHDCLNSVDPLFCEVYAGELSLCRNSACLPGNNDWHVLIGARAQGCEECSSPTQRESWGALKAMFR